MDEIDHTLLNYDLKYLLNMDVPLPEIHIQLEYIFEPFEISRENYLNMFDQLMKRRTEPTE